jgi:FMN phosphatase YigB (HAD superfamily)
MPLNARAPARPIRVVFLDDGGVMSDNELRGAQFKRLLGEFFAPRLGGSVDAWADANVVVFAAQWERWMAFRASGVRDVGDWWLHDNRRWLSEMCDLVGVPVPEDVDGTVEASQRYVVPRVRAAFPETVDTIRALARRARLETASGQGARMLDETLDGLGVRELFGPRLFGPDLLGEDKTGSHFYAAILEDTGVEASEGLVVDDSAEALDWARAAGLRTALMDRSWTGDGRHPSVRSLDEVAGLLGG